MSLDLTIDRSKDEVTSAIYEFAARRGLAATTPWYLDGIRIEDTHVTMQPPPLDGDGGVWSQIASFLTPPTAGPVVSIELSKRRNKTRVVMSLGAHPGSVSLAQSIRTYLQDNRAYDVQTPLTCSRCAAQITHFIARYCGRCGMPLGTFVPVDSLPQRVEPLPPLPESRVAAWSDRPEPSPEQVRSANAEPSGSFEREVVSPRVVVERADPVAVEPAVRVHPPAAEPPSPPVQQPAESKRERIAESEPATEVD